MTEPEEFTSLKGNTIPRRISVDEISFSAHVDYAQNAEFIEQVKAQHVVRRSPSYCYLKKPIYGCACLRYWCMVKQQAWAV